MPVTVGAVVPAGSVFWNVIVAVPTETPVARIYTYPATGVCAAPETVTTDFVPEEA